MQNSKKSCQVAGCDHPLPMDRVYHTRYRICPFHAGLPEMVQDGKVVRFCQQCGRFQPIADFEGSKKSCRNKLKMHNAQRKRAREKAQAAIKQHRRRIPSPRKLSSPSPSSTPLPEEEISTEEPSTPEMEVEIIGAHTPIKREVSPVLNQVVLALAAEPVLDPHVAAEARPATAAVNDGCEIAPLTAEEIDTLMQEFNSPLASQISLSIVKEQEEEELWQRRLNSPELLDPIITIDPPRAGLFFNSDARYNCSPSPFVRCTPAHFPRTSCMPASTDATGAIYNGAADGWHGSCNLDKPKALIKNGNIQVEGGEIAPVCEDHDLLESEVVAASVRLFRCHPAFLPVPIHKHLRSLLLSAKN